MLGETFHSRCVCHITSADIPYHSNRKYAALSSAHTWVFSAGFGGNDDSVKCPDNKEYKYKIMLAEKLKLLANNFSLLSFFPICVCLFFVLFVCL